MRIDWRTGFIVVSCLGLGCASPPQPRAVAAPAPTAFDPTPWLEDHAQLRDALTVGYANLQWTIEAHRIDPVELDRRIVAGLKGSRSDRDALWQLLEFVAAFRDGHLRLDVRGHPVYGDVPRYPIRLESRDDRAVIRAIDAPGCALLAGDEVTAVQGRPVESERRRYRRLVHTVRDDRALATATRLLVRSPFLPRDGLEIRGIRAGEQITCRLLPVAPPPGPPPSSASRESDQELTELPWSTSGADACTALGFQPETFDFVYPLPADAERIAAGGDEFPAATLATPSGQRVGVIRIGTFRDRTFHALCAATWDHLARRQSAVSCDAACLDEFAYHAVPQGIVLRFRVALEALEQRGVTAVVIDVVDNGGGTDWVEDVARMLSDREPPCGKMAAIRHPHWSERYDKRVGELKRLLEYDGLSADDRALARRALAHARRLHGELATRCDLGRLWTEPGFSPSCSLVATSDDHLCGESSQRLYRLIDAFASSGTTERAGASSTLIWQRRPVPVAVYTGPLFVLSNRNSASASEQFINRLQSVGRGVLIGEATHGSGCGYTNGGLDMVLEHSGLRVRMPDCVRYLHTGENELAGIAPAIALDMSTIRSPEFAAELVRRITATR